jgi:hypothetical protein
MVLFLATNACQAFSLLGPYEDWMQTTNGFRWNVNAAVNGGPMDLTAEYRWNVPVVTYAFDQSFLDYFGTNGVAAIERAIQMINDLPDASSVVLTNFPQDSKGVNYSAQEMRLFDLTSVTLGVLVEQLGLASPAANSFVLRRYQRELFWPFCLEELCWFSWAVPNFVLERNFDPETTTPTHWVNGLYYSGTIVDYGARAEMTTLQIDPTAIGFNAVADESFGAGEFYSGLTYDDIGGLRYLYATNNINFETLLPDVHGVGTNANSFVNGAWRPGVNKVTFVRQQYDSVLGQGVPLTNQFSDIYFTNNQAATQQLQRIVTQPDFLFSVLDYDKDHIVGGPMVLRNSATNWINLSALNSQVDMAGPGLIRPPGRISFTRMGAMVDVYEFSGNNAVYYVRSGWGYFNATNLQPIGVSSVSNYFNIPLYTRAGPEKIVKWKVPVPFGGTALLQISTNLTNWTTLGIATNQGDEVWWLDRRRKQTQFYRVVPQ